MGYPDNNTKGDALFHSSSDEDKYIASHDEVSVHEQQERILKNLESMDTYKEKRGDKEKVLV
jgi:hypothetical protein